MTWNWERTDWPNFRWDPSAVAKAEEQFLLGAGALIGVVKHLGGDERVRVVVQALGSEAMSTSEIEGEMLDRSSIQSSLRKQFGLQADRKRVKPAEQGIAEMMVDLYLSFAAPLSGHTLFAWHRMVTNGRRDLHDVGRYRTSPEPMQIVSGAIYRPKVHFEAPPSSSLKGEMGRFLHWFNRSGRGSAEPLPALTRAGIAHLYFETIHPFEDGNGRIGRALAEKSLAQSLGQPSLTALATTILRKRKSYYQALQTAGQRTEISPWLVWFAETVLEAQKKTTEQVEFLIGKAKLLDGLRGTLNSRQEKALLRMLREGPEGFQGGLSAGKYSIITGASPATTTRDLVELVSMGALLRTGAGKYTRYQAALPAPTGRWH